MKMDSYFSQVVPIQEAPTNHPITTFLDLDHVIDYTVSQVLPTCLQKNSSIGQHSLLQYGANLQLLSQNCLSFLDIHLTVIVCCVITACYKPIYLSLNHYMNVSDIHSRRPTRSHKLAKYGSENTKTIRQFDLSEHYTLCFQTISALSLFSSHFICTLFWYYYLYQP